MSQTATTLSGGHSYTTLTVNTQLAKNQRSISSYEAGIRKLVDWFGSVQFVNGLQYTIIPAGKLHYKDRVVFKFTLSAVYASHFVLLKSLFELGRPSSLLITSDRVDKTFTVEVSAEQAGDSVSYFESIINWLLREIKFKAALRQVISWEEKVRKEQHELIGYLHASVN